MKQVLIYGVPASGKTTLSKLLRDKTKFALVHGDNIRKGSYIGTKSAWRRYGPLTKESAIKGLHDVREDMRIHLQDNIVGYDRVIFEAVFIDPVQYHNKADVFLIVTTDEAEHRSHFFERWPETTEKIEGFQAVRIIQEYLIEEAENLGVKIIHNTGDTDKALGELVSQL